MKPTSNSHTANDNKTRFTTSDVFAIDPRTSIALNTRKADSCINLTNLQMLLLLEWAGASTGLCVDVSSGVKRDDGSSNEPLTPQRQPSAGRSHHPTPDNS